MSTFLLSVRPALLFFGRLLCPEFSKILATLGLCFYLSACNPLIGNPNDNPNYHPGVQDGTSASSTLTPTATPTITPTPTPATVDNSETLFNEGSYTGSAWDSTNSYVRLNTATNNAELSSDWAPEWTHLVGYWKLDEAASAATVADSSGNGHTGTVVGGLTLGVSGKVNTAATFGSGTYINFGDIAEMDAQSQVTISYWLYRSGGTNDCWLEKYSSASARVDLSTYSDGNLYFIEGNNSNFATYPFTSTGWHQVSVVYDGTQTGNSNRLKGYIDGNSVSLNFVGTIPSTLPNTAGTNLYLGIDTVDGSLYSNCTMDEVAIWSTALTAAEVQTIYSRQSAAYAGTFTSRVMDAYYSGQIWQSLGWTTTLPYYKELPDAGASESSSNYSSQSASLMNGIAGLWHLNEAVGTSASGSITDDSGNGNNGTPSGGVTFGGGGNLGTAATFTAASNQYIDVGSAIDPIASTYAAWINATSFPNTYNEIISRYSGGGVDNELLVRSDGKLACYVYAGSSQPNYDDTGTHTLNTNQWYFLTMTYDSTTGLNCYVDGEIDGGAAADGNLIQGANNPIKFGGSSFFVNRYYDGSIDEVAIWSRALSSTEVLELYRRGANRIKYQVQSCSSSASCSSSPNWMGPDGTNQTYFSELYNATSNILGDTVLSGSPLMLFGSTGFTDLGLSVPANGFFQYRAIMESDDSNNLCNYGSGSAPCSPELQSVSVDSAN